MTPGKYALSIYRGDSYRWQFKLWTDTAKTQPVDLTDVTAKAEIRDKAAGAVSGSLTCVVTLPNIIDASITATDSAALRSGVWDLQLTYAGGDVSTVLAGAVTVTVDVTDSAAAMAAASSSSSRRLRTV
jgi:hypothetical protein